MDPAIAKRYEHLQAKLTQLGELARSFAAAAPRQAEGTDRTGWIRVLLGPDGIPSAVTVRNGWARHIQPDQLGIAVVEANQNAVDTALQAWSDGLEESDWSARRARFDAGGPGAPATSPTSVPDGTPGDVQDLTEQVLGLLGNAQRQQPVESAVVEGSDGEQRVSVRVGRGGMLGCSVDADWAARVDGDRITAAVNRALQPARAQLPAATSQPAGDLDRLAGNILATLRAITEQPLGGVTGDPSAER